MTHSLGYIDLVADLGSSQTEVGWIREILIRWANAGRIGAKRVLLDFRAPDVEQFVYMALEMSLESPTLRFIDEIVVLDDDASHRPRHI